MATVGSVDVELLLIGWLQERLPDVVVRDELDNNLAAELPTVQVQRVGGDDDGLRLDRALVDVDVYTASRAEAITLSATIRGLLLAARGSATAAAVLGRVGTVSAPAVRPYENTALRRVGATYEIYCHPVS
ncbi:phage tail termination protein [Streptomyces sp. NRRL F-5630]|uniref:phage tail termination protein n=1 Tax=Streptomyces sp. NRRL F-5630 TaxID=1463864 RepID=UPI003EBCD3CC